MILNLISKYCKYWIFIRENKIEEYIKNYLIYVSNEIKEIKDEINADHLKREKIKELENLVEGLEEKIRPTNEKIRELRDEMIKIKEELGIKDFTY
jgi:predicted  nucleic acid-binding Zn-ribbon protein